MCSLVRAFAGGRYIHRNVIQFGGNRKKKQTEACI